MADLEIVAFDAVGKEIEAPQGLGDRYLAKKALHLEQELTTDSTIDGRAIATDGTKLDLITVTSPVDLDVISASQGPGAVILKGGWDASTNLFPVSTLIGETWICTTAGLVDGVQFELNDRVTALIDGASTSTYTGNWIQTRYADSVESVAGKTGAVVLEEADISDFGTYLVNASLDSLAKLNALVLDATLGDAADFATAAQGVLASTAVQDADLDSLVKLNALVLDATLDDVTGSRPPTAHTHVQADITDLADPSVKPVSTPTYDVIDGDSILHVTYTSTGAVTSLTLMNDQVIDGRKVTIKDAGGNALINTITIDTEGSQTIDGAATKLIDSDYGSCTVYCDGLNWFVI